MKFIIDAQLPRSLSNLISQQGYDSIHTLDLDQQNRTKDSDIIAIAIDQERIVITKDSDFVNSFLLKREPQKLIIVKTGNISNSDLLTIFSINLSKIAVLLVDSSLIEINKDEIVVHV